MKNGGTFTLVIILTSLILFSLLNLPLVKATTPVIPSFVINDDLKECKIAEYGFPSNWTHFKIGISAHEVPDYLLSTDEGYGELLCGSLGHKYEGILNLSSGEESRIALYVNHETDACKVFIMNMYLRDYNKQYNENWTYLSEGDQVQLSKSEYGNLLYGQYVFDRACSSIGYNFTGELIPDEIYNPNLVNIMDIFNVNDLIPFIILSLLLLFFLYAILKFRKKLKSRIKSLPHLIPSKPLKRKKTGLKKSTGKWPLFTYMSPWALGFNIISIIFFIISAIIGMSLFTGLSYESKIASLRFMGNTTNLLIVFSPLVISILISILGIFKKNVKTTMTTRFLTLLIGPEKVVKKLNNLILTFAGIFFILLGVYLLFSMYVVSPLY